MRNKQILLSGRAVVSNAANVPADRYSFLHLSDAEPSLGVAQEDEYVLVYDTNSPGQRLWSKKLITAYQHANNAYESQNATGIYANAAFLQANSAYESQNVTGTYANNAYLHANSAYDSQNTTGVYANASFLQANSAYESQNVTGTYANNAYLHANSAYDSQNTTGVYANSAYESQNVTGTYANNAYVHANSAYESQNTTGIYANAAFLKSNSAYESQNATGTYANNAYIHANSAYDSQNTTGIYANASFLKVNSAYQHANSAYESQNTTGVYANAAFLKANSAYDSQNVTGNYTNTAFEFANSAGQYANSAFDYANSSYTHANASFEFANTRYASTGGEISGDVTITGNLLVQGAQFITQTDTLAVHDNMIYLNNPIAANVTNAVGNGTHVIYTTDIAHGYDVGMGVSISGITPSSFNISGASNTLIGEVTTNTFTVVSTVTDTYVSGGTARGRTSLNPDLGFAGGYYDTTYGHAGLFRDATDGTWKFFYNYTPEPDVSPYIDTNHESFRIANLTANIITDVLTLRGYDPLDASNAAYDHANSSYESQNTTGVYANSAFLKANSSYDSQNVTGTYANNAYLHANSAYESQNVTGTYANAAFLQANSAYESQNVTGTYANNAYEHANSAYESQNTTGIYANSAFLQANSAYESQNVTGTYANNSYLQSNSAFIKANSAYESQNVTGTYANNAYVHANSAYASQNTTGVYANAAFTKANSAYASQNTTGIYANSSFLKVNAAYQHANSAYDSQNVTGLYANSAFEKANAAVFTLTANTNQIYTNVATGNIQIGLANVNNDIGTYGGQEAIPVVTVDGYGRILSIANTSITVPPGTYIFPNTNQLTANATSGNIQIGLANVNNDIGTYGGAEAIPVFEVDGYGRILSVSNTSITVPPGTYIFPNTSELTANANSGNVLIGLYAIANNVGTFGSEFAVPSITIDTFGRVTDIVNTTISIPQGTYIINSNLITANSETGNVVLGLATSGVTPGTYGGIGQTPVITVDEYGRITFGANVESAVNTLSTIIRNTYTATSGQTGFNTTGTFTPGYADVYVNGIKLSPEDYVANPAGSINIVNPTLLDGDVVDIQTATTFIVDSSTSYEKQTFVATAGQTTFSYLYSIGELNVYLNGLRLKDTDDYTANTGTSIVFPIALEENDIVEVERLARTFIKIVNPYMGTRETFVATANGESTFTPVGGYRIGFVDVYLNGIKLNIPNDVTANNGTDFTIVSPPILVGDVVEIVGVAAEFSIANAISVTGGTITGSLSVTQTVNAATFNATSNVNTANLVATKIQTNDAFISGNVTVTENVVANSVNVATVYFNDGTLMTTAASGTGGGGGITWIIASANTTANSGEGILVDTTSANVHITLPASPELGNTVRIVDMTGNFGINNCIIERNGQVIMGLEDRLVISTNNAGIGLVFSNATHGWRIIENP